MDTIDLLFMSWQKPEYYIVQKLSEVYAHMTLAVTVAPPPPPLAPSAASWRSNSLGRRRSARASRWLMTAAPVARAGGESDRKTLTT